MYGTVKMNNNICLKGNIYAVYDVFQRHKYAITGGPTIM